MNIRLHNSHQNKQCPMRREQGRDLYKKYLPKHKSHESAAKYDLSVIVISRSYLSEFPIVFLRSHSRQSREDTNLSRLLTLFAYISLYSSVPNPMV
jgi:hypothetical protein